MKAKLNYWVDVTIAITFALSAASGLVFLLPAGSGSGVLGLSFSLWDQLHTWGSLGLMAGVLMHLVLHAKWIASMTRKTLLPRRTAQRSAVPASGTRITRRQFLGRGLAILAAGALAIGCGALAMGRATGSELEDNGEDAQDEPQVTASEEADEPQAAADSGDDEPQVETQVAAPEEPVESQVSAASDDQTVVSEQSAQPQGGVACRKGMINDPYPGRCRLYVDRDGDGICDLSVPGSGSN